MLLPAVMKAYNRARSVVGGIDIPRAADRVIERSQTYCIANPRFSFTNKSDFAVKCGIDPRTRNYFQDASTAFVPFHYLTPTNAVVLTFRYGKNDKNQMAFTRGQLTIRREQ